MCTCISHYEYRCKQHRMQTTHGIPDVMFVQDSITNNSTWNMQTISMKQNNTGKVWLYFMSISHGYFTWLFHMAISHGYFTWLFHMAISHGYFTWLFHMAISHGYFTCLFHMAISVLFLPFHCDYLTSYMSTCCILILLRFIGSKWSSQLVDAYDESFEWWMQFVTWWGQTYTSWGTDGSLHCDVENACTLGIPGPRSLWVHPCREFHCKYQCQTVTTVFSIGWTINHIHHDDTLPDRCLEAQLVHRVHSEMWVWHATHPRAFCLWQLIKLCLCWLSKCTWEYQSFTSSRIYLTQVCSLGTKVKMWSCIPLIKELFISFKINFTQTACDTGDLYHMDTLTFWRNWKESICNNRKKIFN